MPNYQTEILEDFKQARKSIKVAVSWFTDPILLNELIAKSKQGVDVQVIVSADEWNILRFEKFQEIQRYGGLVNKKGSSDNFAGDFMHCKFYIIDDKLAKGGSYNFTKNALTQDNQLDDISSNISVRLKQFNELLSASIDFFTNVANPEKKRSEIEAIEQQGIAPERRREYEISTQKRYETKVGVNTTILPPTGYGKF